MCMNVCLFFVHVFRALKLFKLSRFLNYLKKEYEKTSKLRDTTMFFFHVAGLLKVITNVCLLGMIVRCTNGHVL